MTDDERKLFHELITASQVLLTVSRNAATVLSEEFEDMITGPADGLQAVLDRCPQPDKVWDGVFREEDCTEENFTPDVGEDYAQSHFNVGVKITHKHTGIMVEAYQSPELAINRRRALRVLRRKVEERFSSMGD